MHIEIKKYSSDLIKDYLKFFDKKAFEDNPDWSVCYCMFWHHKGSIKEWNALKPEQNRASAQLLLKRGAINGYLAYADGEPIGWCNVNAKQVYSFDKFRTAVANTNMEDTACLVCFIVFHKFRRKGIGTQLLLAAIEGCRQQGFSYLEAYPGKGDIISDAENYFGPINMYKKNGFELIQESDDFDIVRLAL